MVQITLQNTSDVLGELMANPDYGSFEKSGLDQQFNNFRQEVEMTRIRCHVLEPNSPTPDEIQDRLKRLHASCVGSLARFRPFIERAQAALHAA